MDYPLDRQQSMTAIALEAVPGFFFGIFGIGHLYAGRVGTGLALFATYWFLQYINFLLTAVFGLGFVTGILTHLAFTLFATTNLLSSKRR